MEKAVIFGGTGFIASFLVEYLFEHSIVDEIILVDIEKIESKNSEFR
jgi:nucleoside-diphosphate-sugar epimerase